MSSIFLTGFVKIRIEAFAAIEIAVRIFRLHLSEKIKDIGLEKDIEKFHIQRCKSSSLRSLVDYEFIRTCIHFSTF